MPGTPRTVMLVAGEPSGDALGEKLMRALRRLHEGELRFVGVGGAGMTREGLTSLFPISDVAVMGPREVVPRLPLILRRMRETAQLAVRTRPDVAVMIDSPDFTHNVAKRIARKAPEIPLVNYVSPSVWAWRQGRARAMAGYFRRVLALLPFEPAFYREKAGLDCVFVGHPAVEKVPSPEEGRAFRERHGIAPEEKVLLILPGSRMNEVRRLAGLFGQSLGTIAPAVPGLRAVVPAVSHVEDAVRAAAGSWPLQPLIVTGEGEKSGAFAAADAAIAASGTVSLELGLAGVPMVIGYRIDPLAATTVARMLKVPSVTLVNLILDRPAVREFIQQECTPDLIAAGVIPLLQETPERARLIEDLAEFRDLMGVGGEPPSERAARAVLELIEGVGADGRRAV